MKLNLPNRKTPVATTSLQEKTSGHKFTLPSKSKPAETSSKNVTQTKPKLNLGAARENGVAKQTGSPQVANQTKPVEKAAPKNNAIPQVSDEKYNLVADAEPSLSTEAAEKFRDMLTMLAENIDNEGELQNVLKGTLTHLKENPEVDCILTPEDRATFVRAARKSYGITLVTKTTRKAKVTKASAKVDELMDELADLDFAL